MKKNNYIGLGFRDAGIMFHMRKFFSSAQLNLIEYAFEQGRGVSGYGNTTEDKYKTSIFCYDFGTAKERLVAIMKNIVKNEGTFIP